MEQRKPMTATLIKIAGVRFHDNWKVYDFDATDIDIAVGDKVIIDSDRGLNVARVVRLRGSQWPPAAESSPREEQESEPLIDGKEEGAPAEAPVPIVPKPLPVLKKILRKAMEEDLTREEKNRTREAEAFSVAQTMVSERELPMSLVRAEYSFDASRATFFFFSETRVDFRELVKDLAHQLKSRIEMRQIGVRDVARMIGGFGPCGRELCCSSFLKNFEPVSIRMAKKQEMVLNPAKISGVCGRLLCCLSYEFEMYDENKKDLAAMREAAFKNKRAEEELRTAEVRKEADEDRAVEEKRRQEDRKRQDQRRDKQREGRQKGGGRSEKKKAPQQPKSEQPRERQQARPERQQPRTEKPGEQQQPKPEMPQQQQDQQEQKADLPKQDEGASARKKKRKFWRRKKKGPQQGGNNPPQNPASA